MSIRRSKKANRRHRDGQPGASDRRADEGPLNDSSDARYRPIPPIRKAGPDDPTLRFPTVVL